MKKQTLIEQAKSSPPRKLKRAPASDDVMDLAIAWFNSELTNMQVSTVMHLASSGIYSVLAIAIRQSIQDGRIGRLKRTR